MLNPVEHTGQEAQFSAALTRIHEALFVTSLLQHPSAADINRGPEYVSFKSIETWHQFLDALCQLCQFDKGAENSTSIAVEATSDGTAEVVFWLATNTGSKLELEGSRTKREKNLAMILKVLKKLTNSEDWDEKAESNAAEIILSKSVVHSRDKIANYQSGLRNMITRKGKSERPLSSIAVQLKSGREEERSLLSSLEQLSHERDHLKLCHLAHSFRISTLPDYEILKSKINHGIQGPWKEIRHFIGRLGALETAARFVTAKANWFSKDLQNVRVACVEVPPTEHEVHINTENGLHSVLGQVCPRLKERNLLETTSEKMLRAAALAGRLATKAKETVVHAEAAMAHHFYMNNLTFLNDDRYIGCSKPSCYACTLYLTEHPGAFRSRQTSGNSYLKWAPPLRGNEMLGANSATMRTLASMNSRIDAEILSRAENRIFLARPQFDSTTGKTRTGYAVTVVE